MHTGKLIKYSLHKLQYKSFSISEYNPTFTQKYHYGKINDINH